MTWQAAAEDRKEAGGWRRTKGSFPEHLDLHLRQLTGKLCLVTTFDPSSYWSKAGSGPIRFNVEFFLISIDISIKAEFVGLFNRWETGKAQKNP